MNKNLEKLSNMAKGKEMINMSTNLNPIKKDKKEAVNHPSHYNRPNSMECIDEMVLIFGPAAVMHFCLCNAWKYRYRAGDKNGMEDIAKSDWYIAKYRELRDGMSWRDTPELTSISIPTINHSKYFNSKND